MKQYKCLKKVAKYMICLLMPVQVILGLLWLINNMTEMPRFLETDMLLQATRQRTIDEYMGILYPLLISGAQFLEQLLQVPFYIWLYVLQLTMALYSAYYLMRKIVNSDIWSGILGTAYLATFPMLLQLHLAVLPYSLAVSLTVLMACSGLECFKEPGMVSGLWLIRFCGLWLLCGMLLPEYIIFAGVFAGGVFLKYMISHPRWRGRMLLALVSTVLTFGVIQTGTQTPGSLGRIQKTTGAAMVSRFVWPYFSHYRGAWSNDVSEVFTDRDLLYISRYPEAIVYQFGPALEERYGKEKADRLYLEMAGTAFAMGKKQAIKDIGADLAAYLMPQTALQLQLEHNKSSRSGWNYARFQENAPVLSKYYMNTALAVWDVMILLAVLIWIGDMREKAGGGGLKKSVQKRAWPTGLILSCVLLMGLRYAMAGAGIQDYKNVMPIIMLWLLPGVLGYTNLCRDDEVKLTL